MLRLSLFWLVASFCSSEEGRAINSQVSAIQNLPLPTREYQNTYYITEDALALVQESSSEEGRSANMRYSYPSYYYYYQPSNYWNNNNRYLGANRYYRYYSYPYSYYYNYQMPQYGSSGLWRRFRPNKKRIVDKMNDDASYYDQYIDFASPMGD